MSIVEVMPIGHENAISRCGLQLITGLTDRQIRREIAEARRTTPILNLQNGDGYFIPDLDDDADKAMLRHFVAQEESRLRSIGWSLKSARKALRECEEGAA